MGAIGDGRLKDEIHFVIQHPPQMSRPSYSAPTPAPLPPTLVALSFPPSHQIATTSHQQLLIQMVRSLKHSSTVAQERKRKKEEEMVAEGLLPADVLSGSTASGSAEKIEEETRKRMDEIGFRVGGDLAER